MNVMLLFIWGIIEQAANLFAAPFTNPEMFWIIVPVYLGWFFAEFFQEKKGTSLGNAISNGTIAFWVGADWARTTLRLRAEQGLAFGAPIFAKLSLATLMFVYGLVIIIQGLKARKATHVIGRIRVVTYFVLMLTPIFYGSIEPGKLLQTILAIILFAPIFYYFIEFIDKITPDNPAINEEMGGKSQQKPNASIPDFSAQFNGSIASQEQAPQFGIQQQSFTQQPYPPQQFSQQPVPQQSFPQPQFTQAPFPQQSFPPQEMFQQQQFQQQAFPSNNQFSSQYDPFKKKFTPPRF